MIYIDLFYLLNITLPPFLRGPKLIAFLYPAYTVLKNMQTEFYDFFDRVKYELQFNGQVVMLEHLLNDQFDPALRRIFINSEEQLEKIFIYNVDESIPAEEEIYLYNLEDVEETTETYFYNSIEYDLDNDFTIHVPDGLTFDEIQMIGLVNKYKLVAKRFNIVNI